MNVIDIIKEFCEINGHGFMCDYSGRGMYGETCVAIHGQFNSMHLILCLADVLRDEGFDNAEDILGCPMQDSYGLGVVVYFPKLKEVDLHE